LFSQARSLAALPPSKKVLDGHPSAFAKDDSIHEEKGGEENAHRATQIETPIDDSYPARRIADLQLWVTLLLSTHQTPKGDQPFNYRLRPS
jgi:hypothetical protein